MEVGETPVFLRLFGPSPPGPCAEEFETPHFPFPAAGAASVPQRPRGVIQLNKSDLVDALASNTGMTKADAARAVDALFAPDKGIIAKSLKKGGRVQITGFGTFEAQKRKARTGRNPRTGETI